MSAQNRPRNKSLAPLNGVRRSTVLLGILLCFALLLLSMSSLHTAQQKRQDYRFLSRYLKLEALLGQATTALANERATLHWMAGLDGLFYVGNTLEAYQKKTDEAAQLVLSEVAKSLDDKAFSDHLTFQSRHIRKLLAQFEQDIVAQHVYRASMSSDLALMDSQRDRDLHLFVFNHFGTLIAHLDNLRSGLRYQSVNQPPAILTNFAFSDAAWQISLANSKLSALFEGYITSGNNALGTASAQSASLIGKMEQQQQMIREIEAYNNIDHDLVAKATALSKWYNSSYQPAVRRIVQAIGTETQPPYSNWQWKKNSNTLQNFGKDVYNKASEISFRYVADAQQSAIHSFLANGLLIICSAGLLLCVARIMRKVHHQAIHDELTGLPNRRYFRIHRENFLDGNKTFSQPCGLLLIDLYKFKSVNERLGQTTGDKLLQAVGERLDTFFAGEAFVARMDGDEFSVLIHDDVAPDIIEKANQVSAILSNQFKIEGHSIQLQSCIGCASYPADADCSEDLNKAANLALNAAKAEGAGTVTAFKASIAEAFFDRELMEIELRNAQSLNQFELYYQPQFDLQQQKVSGVEALIRWHHPKRGMVSPAIFIPLAEECGMLPQIGQWVLEQAFHQSNLWRKHEDLQLKMSVNVSAHQFFQGNLTSIIKEGLIREELPPETVELEITESAAMEEMDVVTSKLAELRDQGVQVALDDFGTGFSSLSYLQELPLDTLKIDQSFIYSCKDDKDEHYLLLQGITAIAQSLGFGTVAEGVETQAQLEIVSELGIDTVQGYFYSKPVPAKDIPAMVATLNKDTENKSLKAA